mmetsp:Transcript_47872/g.119754  ORF Transcript_47872/g.119754 Transcript_47872/m.119754 type:complete len:569 (+) Transcript_47872:680-2386(+)
MCAVLWGGLGRSSEFPALLVALFGWHVDGHHLGHLALVLVHLVTLGAVVVRRHVVGLDTLGPLQMVPLGACDGWWNGVVRDACVVLDVVGVAVVRTLVLDVHLTVLVAPLVTLLISLWAVVVGWKVVVCVAEVAHYALLQLALVAHVIGVLVHRLDALLPVVLVAFRAVVAHLLVHGHVALLSVELVAVLGALDVGGGRLVLDARQQVLVAHLLITFGATVLVLDRDFLEAPLSLGPCLAVDVLVVPRRTDVGGVLVAALPALGEELAAMALVVAHRAQPRLLVVFHVLGAPQLLLGVVVVIALAVLLYRGALFVWRSGCFLDAVFLLEMTAMRAPVDGVDGVMVHAVVLVAWLVPFGAGVFVVGVVILHALALLILIPLGADVRRGVCLGVHTAVLSLGRVVVRAYGDRFRVVGLGARPVLLVAAHHLVAREAVGLGILVIGTDTGEPLHLIALGADVLRLVVFGDRARELLALVLGVRARRTLRLDRDDVVLDAVLSLHVVSFGAEGLRRLVLVLVVVLVIMLMFPLVNDTADDLGAEVILTRHPRHEQCDRKNCESHHGLVGGLR